MAAASSGAMELSETLIREVEMADVIVIGTPMNNFTVPSVLKAWIDQLLRVGRTIIPTPAGKVGALRDRPVQDYLERDPNGYTCHFVRPHWKLPRRNAA
jgi:FMN-dependent NADH-azoreductase